MKLPAPRLFLSVVLMAAPMGACATSGDGMQEKLYDATRGYNKALRWSDYDRAAAYVPAESEDRFLDEHQSVEDELVVLDYQLTRLKFEKQDGIASCRVKITWHTDRNLIVRETFVDQLWQFYEGSWYLVDEWRAQGEPLAIFAEKGEQMELDHPYLPGLDRFRDLRDIGLSDDEKRARDKARRKASREASNSHSAPRGKSAAPGGAGAGGVEALPDDEKTSLPVTHPSSGL